MEWLNIVVSILSGLAVCIPLVVNLVSVVRDLIKERNWANLIKMAMTFMVSAEDNFATGAEKKEWVMDSIRDAAKAINYNYDAEAEAKMSDLVDSICNLTKQINK